MANTTTPPDGREIGNKPFAEQITEFCQCVDNAKTMSDELRQSEGWDFLQRMNTPCVKRDAPVIMIKEIVFTGSFTLDKFKEIWPAIKEMILKTLDTDAIWTCLQHVLTYYHQIAETTFAVFMKWLNDVNGEDLITDGNIRRQSHNYFCHHASKQWTKDALDVYANKYNVKVTTALHNKFDRYDLLCENLWLLISPSC